MSDGRRLVGVQESDYLAFIDSVRLALRRFPADIASARLEVSGSLARGELSPPYSDLDLSLIAPTGIGALVRDHVPPLARSVDKELLAIFVDPLNPEGIFCSIYRGPFKVDWWVFEETGGSRPTVVWRGNDPPPYEWSSHCWDWLWWLWSKARRGKDEIVLTDLPRLWLWLMLRGVDPRQLPASLPSTTTNSELLTLLRHTLRLLPGSETILGREIRRAIEGDNA